MLNHIRYMSVVFALIVVAPTAVEAKGVAWSTPPECPAKAKLLAGVTAHLRRAIPAGVSIRAGIRRTSRSYTLTIHMGKGAVRTVTNRDCFVLTETASLIIALAIEEQSPAPSGTPLWERIKDDEQPPAIFGRTGRVKPSTSQRLELPRRPVRLRARAMFGAESGSLPKRTTGGGVGVSAHLRWFELGLSGWYWMERTAPAIVPDEGGDVSLFYGELRACTQLHRLGEWGLCAVGDAGWMRGAGYGVDPDFTPSTVYSHMFSVGGAAQWSVKIQNRLYVRLDIQAMANLTRPEFVFRRPTEIVHKPSTFSARVSAGVEMLIW